MSGLRSVNVLSNEYIMMIITAEHRNETYSLKLQHLNILAVIYNAVFEVHQSDRSPIPPVTLELMLTQTVTLTITVI